MANGFQRWLSNFLGLEETIKENVAKEFKESPVRSDVTFDAFTGKTDERMQYRHLENSVWFRGIPEELELFYKGYQHPIQNLGTKQNLFWQQVTGNTSKRLHFPLASAISRQMSSILFSDEISTNVDSGNKDRDSKLNDRLFKIYGENEVRLLLQKAAQLESYSGGVAFKIAVDQEFSDYPMIQVYPQESIKIKTKYGKIYEIIFFDEYKYANGVYKLHSIYGKGYVRYRLYDTVTNKEVALSSIPQFEGLKDMVFTGPDGEPLKLLMAVYKPNRALSAEFSSENEAIGSSDYEGLSSVFNELDSIFSSYAEYMLKAGKVFTFMTEDQLQKDNEGKVMKPNIYGLDVIPVYDMSTSTDKKTEIKRDVPKLETQPFRDAFKDMINMALVRVGLSSVTFSLDGVTTMMSRESLDSREKTTQKTREDKIKLWQEALIRLSKLVLIYEDLVTVQPTSDESTSIYRVENLYDYNFLVEFPQFESPTREKQIETLSNAIKNKLVDIKHAVYSLYGDEMSEEEMDEMIANIKSENPTKELSNMSSPEPMMVELAKSIEDYANNNIPESEEDFGQFMYQAELIRSGNTELAKSELSKISPERQAIIRGMM
jgi:hypothetical protein